MMYILNTVIKAYKIGITDAGIIETAYTPLARLNIRDIWRPGWTLWADTGERVDPFKKFPSTIIENRKARRKKKRKPKTGEEEGDRLL